MDRIFTTPPTSAVSTLRAMAEKRRARWDEKSALGYGEQMAYDERLTAAAARKILADKSLVSAVRARPWMLIEIAFTIVNKEGKTIPFFFNEAQERLVAAVEREIAAAEAEERHPRPFYILKGRQEGITSWVTAMQLAASITRRNFSGLTLADNTANTAEIFKSRARAVLERLPEILRPHEEYNNAKELYFDKLNSTWRAETATDEVGRSRTLFMCHYSEIATYKCMLSNLQSSVREASAPGALVFYETTANGFNQARDLWESGSCINLFFPWWLSSEYRSSEIAAIERCCASDAWLRERVSWLRGEGLDERQVAWYCLKYDSFLEKDKMKQEYPCFPEEAFIFSGTSLFNTEAVSAVLAEALHKVPVRRGQYTYTSARHDIVDREGRVVGEEWRLDDIKFEERDDGMITIHEEPRVEWERSDTEHKRPPVGYAPYVIGGDTADTGEDYYTAKVVDNITLHTAATLRVQRTSDDLYAEQLLCLAYEYHMALIGPEINYSAQPVRVIVQKYGYGNVYLRERFDKMADETVREPGFRTDKRTKPVIISELQTDLRADPRIDTDPETLKELLTFVRHGNGYLGAVTGAHDDLVMALAIAHHIGCQAPKVLHRRKPERNRTYDADGMGDPYVYPDEIAEIERENAERSDIYGDWDDM